MSETEFEQLSRRLRECPSGLFRSEQWRLLRLQEAEVERLRQMDEDYIQCPGCQSYVTSLPHDDGELSFCEGCHAVDAAERLTKERNARQLRVEILETEIVNQRAEVERLQTCEEIKLVAFLSRPDIQVERGFPRGVVVVHKDNLFKGLADNVISAAREAIQMERQYLAAQPQ